MVNTLTQVNKECRMVIQRFMFLNFIIAFVFFSHGTWCSRLRTTWNCFYTSSTLMVNCCAYTCPHQIVWQVLLVCIVLDNCLLCCGLLCVADENGLLVHCISGWDRTPLFVSLLRLSLWAVSIHSCLSLHLSSFYNFIHPTVLTTLISSIFLSLPFFVLWLMLGNY